jgi:hypothetical protein
MNSRRLIAVLLPLALVACAEVQMATPSEDQFGKRFEPPPSEKGVLYLFREGMLGAMTTVDVTVQMPTAGVDVALASDTWVRLEGDPGPIEVRCTREQNAGQRLDVRSGETRYVEVSYRLAFWGASCGVLEVSPLDGQRGVARGKRTVAGGRPAAIAR